MLKMHIYLHIYTYIKYIHIFNICIYIHTHVLNSRRRGDVLWADSAPELMP